MKVLVCTSEYYPKGSGIANVAYNVVKQLENKGIECEICSPIGPDIKIGNIGEYGRLSLLYFWYKVNRYFKKHKNNYDVVWLHNPLFLSKNPFENCLVTIHTTPKGQTINRIYPWHIHIYKLIASKIDTYCINKFDKEIKFSVVDPTVFNELIEMGINKNNVNYIPNGVDINLFKPKSNKEYLREQFNLPKNNKLILSLGRIDNQKKPIELINIFSRVCKEVKDITLIIGGKGELLKDAISLVKEKNLDNVKFLGYVNHKLEAPNLYACSDYYIMTSAYEGQPLTLLEAMSSGLKCIVSDIPNLKMIIDDANCGISVNIDDENNAVKEIIRYINSDASIHSINARKYSVKNFDWELISNNYLNEFEYLME